MGDEYSGKDLAVLYSTVDISGKARKATVNEESGEPTLHDISHKGDTTKQELVGLLEAIHTAVDFECLDEEDGDASLLDFAINGVDTLKVYPEGQTHGKPELTVNEAYLISRGQPIEYNGIVALSGRFFSKNSLTRGTYSSA